MKKTIMALFKNSFIRKAAVFSYFMFWGMQFLTMKVYAYIDPATTSMVIQIVAGVFISLGFAFGIFRRKLIMFFKNLWIKFTMKKIEKKAKEKE